MSKFEQLFKKSLVTEAEAPVAGETPISDAEAWENSFEKPGDSEQFSTDLAMPGFNEKYVAKAKMWIAKLGEFSNWINGTDEDSLNKQFIDMDKEGSPFAGISSESKKLTNIAKDLAGLSETIKGYILNANKQEPKENA